MGGDLPDWTETTNVLTRLADIVFAGAGTITTSYTLPPGTHALGVGLMDSFANYSNVAIIGGTSGFNEYGQVPSTDGTQHYIFPIVSLLEDTWQVKVTRTAAGAATVRVVAVRDPLAVFILGAQANADPPAVQPLAISQEAAFGSLSSQVFNLSIAASGAVTLLAGAAGKKTYALGWNISTDVASVTIVQLQDTGGTVPLANFHCGTILVVAKPLYGKSTPVGTGVRILNTLAVAVGSITGEAVLVQK